MKIILRGKPPPKYPWCGCWKCHYCNSVIELNDGDGPTGVTYSDDQRDGESVTIECPVCEVNRSLSRHRNL